MLRFKLKLSRNNNNDHCKTKYTKTSSILKLRIFYNKFNLNNKNR